VRPMVMLVRVFVLSAGGMGHGCREDGRQRWRPWLELDRHAHEEEVKSGVGWAGEASKPGGRTGVYASIMQAQGGVRNRRVRHAALLAVDGGVRGRLSGCRSASCTGMSCSSSMAERQPALSDGEDGMTEVDEDGGSVVQGGVGAARGEALLDMRRSRAGTAWTCVLPGALALQRCPPALLPERSRSRPASCR
jgi:hypothetical protein